MAGTRARVGLGGGVPAHDCLVLGAGFLNAPSCPFICTSPSRANLVPLCALGRTEFALRRSHRGGASRAEPLVSSSCRRTGRGLAEPVPLLHQLPQTRTWSARILPYPAHRWAPRRDGDAAAQDVGSPLPTGCGSRIGYRKYSEQLSSAGEGSYSCPGSG